MYRLIKKDFSIEILWQELKYKQLSYYECIELHYLITKWLNIKEWTYNFLKDKIIITYEDLSKIDIDKFFNIYLDTACRWFYSKDKKKNETIPFEAYITFLSKEINIDPLTLIKEYTPEAINCITDGIIYNINEQTEQWRNKNRINQEIKNTPKEEKDKILKNVEKIDKLLNK